jgi:two-component system sensor histidine kinase AlgZ
MRMALVMLASSQVMSVLNAVLGQRLAISLGLGTAYHRDELLLGRDRCWLALIAFS